MDKPECKLISEDGNVFNVIGRVARALKGAGLDDQAKEFTTKAYAAQSYDEVLQLAMTYVDIV